MCKTRYEIGHITALFTPSLVIYQNVQNTIGELEEWRWLYLCVDCKEGQSLLSEHIHPGGRLEGGVSRDDVRGHCITAAESACGDGQTPPVSQQVKPCDPDSMLGSGTPRVSGVRVPHLVNVDAHLSIHNSSPFNSHKFWPDVLVENTQFFNRSKKIK